ncbi:UDP-glycosyltransferase UGT5-like isoform X4 [Anastrepha ludens]|uniref:UDP-glycosyltransferase UGT5-like isoform X4 n=1 Tax=Anastrepha ludens TaxID=28586 RepID=UPI0023B1D70D|nr:UDP-glycosyltransferase UGT5-like isoform X4 [Anastrepha ludens]
MASVSLSLIALSVVLVLSTIIHSSDGARILAFFPTTMRSHQLMNCALANALAQAGHSVTVLGATRNVYPSAKYRYIRIDGPTIGDNVTKLVINMPDMTGFKYTGLLHPLLRTHNATLAQPRIKQFLRSYKEDSFDLLLITYVGNDFHLGLGAHFKCPIVMFSVAAPTQKLHNWLANSHEISYVPTRLSGLMQPMAFHDRVLNFLWYLFEVFAIDNFMEAPLQEFYNYNFPPDRYPPLDEVRKNVSLVFVNHHFSQGPIRPNVPNLIEIGGIQIKEKPDPLPADIGKVLDEAKEGVIYFSLGTNIQSTHLTEEKAKIMFNVISKLPYKVLWKWGDSDRPGQSNNIIYKDWLPQDDILAHPNIKLFITHGGMGSVVEAQYHGVPMVGIPLFGDQPSNMANVERSGYGLSVDYITLSEESLNKAIQEVLHNPKYTKTVRDFSRLYRDRPMSPRETVVYWVEYVLRHNGAKHMQSPAVHMNRWQLMSLDVIGFLLAIVGCVVAVFVKICMLLCCRRKTKTAKVTKVKVKKAKKNE